MIMMMAMDGRDSVSPGVSDQFMPQALSIVCVVRSYFFVFYFRFFFLIYKKLYV